MTTWERVTAADLRPGDRFASVRDEDSTETVHSIGTIGERARRIYIGPPGMDEWRGRPMQPSIRPRHTTKFWRVVA